MMINGKRILGGQLNGKEVLEARLNNKNVFSRFLQSYAVYGSSVQDVLASPNVISEQGFATPRANTAFWGSLHAAVTPLSDGWCKVQYDNTEGSTSVTVSFYPRLTAVDLKTNTEYTIVIFLRNVSPMQANGLTISSGSQQYDPFAVSSSATIAELNTGYITRLVKTKSSFDGVTYGLRMFISASIGHIVDFEIRAMIIEGNYVTESLTYHEYGVTVPSPPHPSEINSVGKKEGKLLIQSGDVTTEIPLQRSLKGISGVRDTLEYTYIQETTLNGSENWYIYDADFSAMNYYSVRYDYLVNAKPQGEMKLSHFTYFIGGGDRPNQARTQPNTANLLFFLGKDVFGELYTPGFTDYKIENQKVLAAWKAWLSQNNVDIQYQVLNPTPQNLAKPNIPYFGQPPFLLNEVQGEIQYTTPDGVLHSTSQTTNFLKSGYSLVLDSDGHAIADSDGNLIATKGE